MAQVETPTIENPLDPLTEEEINYTTEILQEDQNVGNTFGFYSYQPVEPSKEELEAWDGNSVDREVSAVLRDFQEKTTYEATVSLPDGEVMSWERLPDAQPHIPGEDVLEAEEAMDAFEFREETLRVPTEWVRTIDGLSGHVAGNRLMEFARAAAPQTISLVHGPPDAAAQLRDHLTANTDATEIHVAEHLEEMTVEGGGGNGDESGVDVRESSVISDELMDLHQREQRLRRELNELAADIEQLTQRRRTDGEDDLIDESE